MKALDPYSGVQIRIGVMGSASGKLDAASNDLCHRLGGAIAQAGCCLLTGACPGMPHSVVLGAKGAGGHVVGISPASSLREHVEKYESPFAEYDVLLFTGLGMMGRELVNIRSSDIIVIVGGQSGTLGEFAIAYEEGKLIGVLEQSGGITSVLRQVETSLVKPTGAEVHYDADPEVLIARVLHRYLADDYHCPCHPGARPRVV